MANKKIADVHPTDFRLIHYAHERLNIEYLVLLSPGESVEECRDEDYLAIGEAVIDHTESLNVDSMPTDRPLVIRKPY